MDFENQLSEDLCLQYFDKMFGNIWEESILEKIIFPDGLNKSNTFNHWQKRNQEKAKEERSIETIFYFLAGYFGNSLWEILSNNHSVFLIADNNEFSIGSWRGSGSFIAHFIEQKINLNFDYLDFYMDHFHDDAEAKNSYKFIFLQLKKYGLDWHYEYPSLDMTDFS